MLSSILSTLPLTYRKYKMEEQELIDNAVTEIDDITNKVEVVDNICEESIDICEQLADIQDIVLDTDKAPTDTTVKVAEIAVEALCQRLGIKADVKVSFENHTLAVESVVEKIKEVGKKIWESLVKAFKWLVDKIEQIFIAVTKNREHLLKKLKQQQAAVESIKDEQDASGQTLTGQPAHDFAVSGKANAETAKQILTNTAKLLVVSKKGSEVVQTYVDKFKNHKELLFEFNFSGKTEQEDPLNASLINDIVQMLEFLGLTHKGKDSGAGSIDNFYGTLLAGNQINLRSVKGPARIYMVKTGTQTAKTADVLSKSEMLELLSASIKLVDELKKFDSTMDHLKKQSKECSAYCVKRYSSNSFLARTEKDPKSDKAIASALFTLNGLVSKLTILMPVTVFKTANAAGRYVEMSMRKQKVTVENINQQGNNHEPLPSLA